MSPLVYFIISFSRTDKYERHFLLEMSVETKIRRSIALKSKITFAEFMDIAMFSTEHGYYHSPLIWGVQGDYYTSPLVHPGFSAMLSIQLFQMWDFLNKPDPFYVVELGCGNGVLG